SLRLSVTWRARQLLLHNDFLVPRCANRPPFALA
ncbi:MAG: hypothetical protein QOJ83_2039, partial [Frankiales bacterium]|nr:hypothetical protein [Frankiales bacterium]